MPGILAWGEALLVSLRSDPYLSLNVPSKVAACLAAGKPIIACVEGETGRAIADNDVGLTCSPENPALLAETIGRFMALSNEERSEMGKRSRLTFERCYDKDILIGEYVSLLEGLACRR
jgi:glycosyltransferase involved in cell wall biosynthesis